ncbi:MAG: ion transporter [Tannerellaceae bacterium]
MDRNKLKDRIREIIFESNTKAGKAFDVGLLVFIFLSVILVLIDSVNSLHIKYLRIIHVTEWIITVAFTIEYILRVYSVRNRKRYITSFFGIVDLLSILPTYLSLFIAGTHYLVVIRALRLLRIFRIFKLSEYLSEGSSIMRAVKRSFPKIFVFMFFVTILVTILGSIMYVVEGSVNPKMDNIPRCIYWAIVTLTTVGYGDITPITYLGQFISMIIMLLGYAIIAVPTGIISAEMIRPQVQKVKGNACPGCGKDIDDDNANYCKHCGTNLERENL